LTREVFVYIWLFYMLFSVYVSNWLAQKLAAYGIPTYGDRWFFPDLWFYVYGVVVGLIIGLSSTYGLKYLFKEILEHRNSYYYKASNFERSRQKFLKSQENKTSTIDSEQNIDIPRQESDFKMDKMTQGENLKKPELVVLSEEEENEYKKKSQEAYDRHRKKYLANMNTYKSMKPQLISQGLEDKYVAIHEEKLIKTSENLQDIDDLYDIHEGVYITRVGHENTPCYSAKDILMLDDLKASNSMTYFPYHDKEKRLVDMTNQ